MELLQILLQIFIPTSIALTAAFIASRGKYIHDFRTFDLNFFSNQILSKTSQDRKTARAYKEIAKRCIKSSLRYKCTALFYTFSISYMLLALLFCIPAFIIHTLFLFPAFFSASLAFFVIIIEEHLHLPPRKSHKMGHKFIGFLIKRVIWLNFLVSLILKKTPFGIQYLSSWKEINEEIENDNELKDFIEQGNYLAQPLKDYNILPGN